MRSKRINFLFQAVLAILFSLLAYTFLHELGHALTGILSGGSLTHFSVNFVDLTASAGLSGDFSRLQRALIQIAGILTPYALWLLANRLVPRRSSGLTESVMLLSGVMVSASLITWIFIPVLTLWNIFPSDDSTSFLATTALPPLLVSLAFSFLFWLILRRVLARAGSRTGLAAYLRDAAPWQGASSRRAVITLAMLIAMIFLAAFALNGFRMPFGGQTPQTSVAPPGYNIVQVINLSERSYENEVLMRFTVPAAKQVGFFLRIVDLDTAYLDIALRGSNGYAIVLIHGEGFSSNDFTYPFEETLQPGDYEVRLTSAQAQGVIHLFSSEQPSGNP